MTEVEIRENLRTDTFGKTLFAYDSIDSTTAQAKKLVADGAAEGTLVIAEEQTAGRGRLGRQWVSAKGMNLTYSLILRPALPPQSVPMVSLYAAVAVAQALTAYAPVKPACKWPNDIMLKGKKVCGILSETLLNGDRVDAVILGIGININQTDFPDELQSTATSLARETGKRFDRITILGSVLLQLEKQYRRLHTSSFDSIIEDWKELSPMLGKPVQVHQNEKIIKGTAIDIASDGALLIQTGGEVLKLYAGDVTLSHP